METSRKGPDIIDHQTSGGLKIIVDTHKGESVVAGFYSDAIYLRMQFTQKLTRKDWKDIVDECLRGGDFYFEHDTASISLTDGIVSFTIEAVNGDGMIFHVPASECIDAFKLATNTIRCTIDRDIIQNFE